MSTREYLIGDVSKEQLEAFLRIDRVPKENLVALLDDCLTRFNEVIKIKQWFIDSIKAVSHSYGSYFKLNDRNQLIIDYEHTGQVQLCVIWHRFNDMFHGMPDIMKLYNIYVNKTEPTDLIQEIINGNHINTFKLLLRTHPNINWGIFQIKNSVMVCLILEKEQATSPK
jgi:hypothetical protein